MICIAARVSISPAVLTDSKVKRPELIIRSLPEVITGEKGSQNQSIYHRLRYSDVLVKMMTQRLNIASIVPIGFCVLFFNRFSIQHEMIENPIRRKGSMRNVIFQPSTEPLQASSRSSQ